MWIVGAMIIIALLLISTNLYYKKRYLEKQAKYLKPMVETVENVRDILYYCETVPKLNYLYLSPIVNELIGPNTMEEHMLDPEKIFEIVHPDDYDTLRNKKFGELDFCEPITVRLRNHEGKYIWFEEYATPVMKDGKYVAVQGILRNIDEKVALQQQLEYKTTHDTLTDLYNREFFQMKLEEYNEHRDVPIAIIMADLDELKSINDQFGHLMGDRLIQDVGTRLKKYMDENIVVARIGGDEFAILLANVTTAEIEEYIKKIRDEMKFNDESKPYTPIQLSIGYAYSQSSIGVMEKLLGEADAEMYKDKNGKKGSLEPRLSRV
ncbi:sensor domain-containing diguanylate cyclase [Ornithinibacillus halophilus]|uniref:PAS domain S-box-containing protein/diguanylate cyclase (GGDEF) domain-containing protein n=1 Tax=Ornithinibacillus halophilus TaxID=930117 RepID=A0A1M5MYW1_9BACI|nr:sensor domain-containing diguanylate cyclase [Ornithinibacillus halophilus]SHG81933.1 PAS domain S-box-containing protein/diguanylate cyclase (GGDEF) domain-containing protein [Ornithinibacillus halophilus]